MPTSETTICAHCGTRFERGRRQNQHQRAGAAHHQGGRYCSGKCRTGAFRARERAASLAGAQKPRERTATHASVTDAPYDSQDDFATQPGTAARHFERK